MAPFPTTHHHRLMLSSLLLLLLHPPSSRAQTSPNITLGSILHLDGDTATPCALSPSGDFAFGFLPLDSDRTQFLLAIWYAMITGEQTIVWTANGDKPVQKGSSAVLASSGQLLLRDPSGQQVWNSGSSDGAAYATMLDSGNLVLQSNASGYLWQSFDYPTDTILPSQVMSHGGKLSSRYSWTVYSTGRFQLRLLPDGNLVMNTIGFPKENAYDAYWISVGTLGSGLMLIFNESTGVHIVQNNASVVNVTSANIRSVKNFYQRASLDPDGVFRHYVRPKPGFGNATYSDSWSEQMAVPDNICASIIVKTTGSGICGFNSYCQINGSRPTCLCPRRYTNLDPSDPSQGCTPDFDAPSCRRNETALFDLVAMDNTDWPQAGDYEWFSPMEEDECRRACLEDCRCMVAITRGADCWKKKIPMSNGRFDPTIDGKALIKVSKGDAFSPTPLPPERKREKKGTPIFVWGVLGSSLFINCVSFSFIALTFFYTARKKPRSIVANSRLIGLDLRAFSYGTLVDATDNFKEELGKGSFGTVYKGALMLDTEIPIAVKKLGMIAQEGEKEFRAEMNAIGRTHHKNLVQLLGFCDEGPHRLLIYELMSNGSLANYLFGSEKPSWERRVLIAFGVARGLAYLHEECGIQIIHCDIKPQNILLDDSFTARISDFGLAKLLMADQTRTATDIRGTKGYVAPEWFKNRAITAKVDVYSFGVVLLEIICCRRNVELSLSEDQRDILTDLAYDCYVEKRLESLVEDDEEAKRDKRRLHRLVKVALWCIQEEPSMRPSMKKVTQMLEGSVDISEPPGPTSFISSIN